MAKKTSQSSQPAKPVRKSAKTAKRTAKGHASSSKSAAKTKSANRKAKKKADVSLGRPLVTQEEKLYLLFKDDYHARQIFEFLRVNTVKELEQFSAQQIVRRVSKPVFDTVDRIRAKLAEMKRSLRDDEAYAREYREQHRES
jgi:hypothetical protein